MANNEGWIVAFTLSEDEATTLLAFLVDVPLIRKEHRKVVLELQNGLMGALASEGEEEETEEEDEEE